MSVPFDAQFSADDHYFHAEYLTPERADHEAAEILRLLGSPCSGTILDAGCGDGRLAVRLARAGLSVTAIDHDAGQLDRARSLASDVGVSMTLVEGDLARLEFEAEFDFAVMWFNTFGFLDDAANQEVIAGLRRSLKVGGQLVIDTLNHDAVVRHLVEAPEVVTIEIGDDRQIDESQFDVVTGRLLDRRTVIRDGQTTTRLLRLRLPTPPEWGRILGDAGFQVVSMTGENGHPLDLDQWSLVIVAEAV